MQLDPLFIDTGGIDLLVDPKDLKIIKFWQRFGKNARHSISHVVYWEFLRQFRPNANSLSRQIFVKLVKRDRLELLPFGKTEAELAVAIYNGVKQKVGDDADGRSRLTAMQCDIMISATAVTHRKLVLTQDVKDWALIKAVVEDGNLGTLPISDKKDILAI